MRYCQQQPSHSCCRGTFEKNQKAALKNPISDEQFTALKYQTDAITTPPPKSPTLSNTYLVDIERAKTKYEIQLDLQLSPKCRLIEMIVHPKQIARKGLPCYLKQDLGIFSDALPYEHYPAVDLYDTNLVEVEFFDILETVMKRLNDTASCALRFDCRGNCTGGGLLEESVGDGETQPRRFGGPRVVRAAASAC